MQDGFWTMPSCLKLLPLYVSALFSFVEDDFRPNAVGYTAFPQPCAEDTTSCRFGISHDSVLSYTREIRYPLVHLDATSPNISQGWFIAKVRTRLIACPR